MIYSSMVKVLPDQDYFEFNPFAVDSLLVQAIKHVTKGQPMLTKQSLQDMSRKLNDCIQLGVEPYDSPPSHGYQFDFRFDTVNKDGALYMQVIDMHGAVVLEWMN